MSIQHVELSGSRSGTDATDRSSTAELSWSVWGSTDHDDCRDHLSTNSVVPATFDGLIFKSLSWEHLGGGSWMFTASYAHPDVADKSETLDVGDYTWGFDTGGETVHRSVSQGTTAYAKAGETAPNFKGAINVVQDQGERKVEGVDIGLSALKLWVRKRVARASITLDYVRTVKNLTYKVNDDTFLGFAAGELLFIGATGQEGTNTDPEVTYNFIASENAASMTIGDISSIVKPGHDYLWTFFEDIEDATAGMTVKQPKAVYVEVVYDSGDMDALGIS